MKITKEQLRRIIEEEITEELREIFAEKYENNSDLIEEGLKDWLKGAGMAAAMGAASLGAASPAMAAPQTVATAGQHLSSEVSDHRAATELGMQIADAASHMAQDASTINKHAPWVSLVGSVGHNYIKTGTPPQQVISVLAKKVANAADNDNLYDFGELMRDIAKNQAQEAAAAADGATQKADDLESAKQAHLAARKTAHVDQGDAMRATFKKFIELGGEPSDVGVQGSRSDYL